MIITCEFVGIIIIMFSFFHQALSNYHNIKHEDPRRQKNPRYRLQAKEKPLGNPRKFLFLWNQIKVRYPRPMTTENISPLDAKSNPPPSQQIHQQETSNKTSIRDMIRLNFRLRPSFCEISELIM